MNDWRWDPRLLCLTSDVKETTEQTFDGGGTPIVAHTMNKSYGNSAYRTAGWPPSSDNRRGFHMTREIHGTFLRVKEPSKAMDFLDAGNWRIHMFSSGTTLRPRHTGKANYLFFDGHIETLAPQEIENNLEFWNEL